MNSCPYCNTRNSLVQSFEKMICIHCGKESDPTADATGRTVNNNVQVARVKINAVLDTKLNDFQRKKLEEVLEVLRFM